MKVTRTEYQRSRILAALSKGPLTAQELADKLHLTRDAINIHLKAMKEALPRLVHIAGYATNQAGGRPAPQYGLGDATDALYISTRDRLQGRKTVVEKTLERVVTLLQRRVMTVTDLSQLLDLTPSHTRWYLNQLRTTGPKQVYIKRYELNDTNYPMPAYAAGSQQDVIYQAKTRRQVYEEAMQDPERRKRILARHRLRHLIDSKRKKPNGIFGALGL